MANEMFAYDEEMAKAIFSYCERRLSLEDVPLDRSDPEADFVGPLKGLLRPSPRDPVEVLNLFKDHVAPGVISCDSPRYLSFIPAAPTKASLLFDMVVSASSLQGISWLEGAGAVAAENQALEFLAQLAGMPSGAGGCFVAGGSAGNLSALVVARDMGRATLGHDDVYVAVSDQAHSSVSRTLHILGMTPLIVPSAEHRLHGSALEAALASDPNGSKVVAVVATAGTTNAGIVDDLAGISAITRARNLWLHVDAAYGGAALLSPSVRHRYEGIQYADSFIIDPHKWLFAPYDCAALLYRNPSLAKAVHTQDASYLDVIHTDSPSAWNPADYAYHLTRRARGLAFWYSLAVYGSDAYRQAVEAALTMAQRTAQMIEATPHLSLVREPELSIVLFRRTGWSGDDYTRWSARLLSEQIAFVTPSKWEGEPVGRLAFLHPDTTEEIVKEVLDSMS